MFFFRAISENLSSAVSNNQIIEELASPVQDISSEIKTDADIKQRESPHTEETIDPRESPVITAHTQELIDTNVSGRSDRIRFINNIYLQENIKAALITLDDSYKIVVLNDKSNFNYCDLEKHHRTYYPNVSEIKVDLIMKTLAPEIVRHITNEFGFVKPQYDAEIDHLLESMIKFQEIYVDLKLDEVFEPKRNKTTIVQSLNLSNNPHGSLTVDTRQTEINNALNQWTKGALPINDVLCKSENSLDPVGYYGGEWLNTERYGDCEFLSRNDLDYRGGDVIKFYYNRETNCGLLLVDRINREVSPGLWSDTPSVKNCAEYGLSEFLLVDKLSLDYSSSTDEIIKELSLKLDRYIDLEIFTKQVSNFIVEYNRKFNPPGALSTAVILDYSLIKEHMTKHYELSTNTAHHVKFTTLLDEIIRYYDNTKGCADSPNYKTVRNALPHVLAELGLHKKRYSDGIHWYGLKLRPTVVYGAQTPEQKYLSFDEQCQIRGVTPLTPERPLDSTVTPQQYIISKHKKQIDSAKRFRHLSALAYGSQLSHSVR